MGNGSARMSKEALRTWATEERAVFICGLARSGTSALQLSLARSDELFNLKGVFETSVFGDPRKILRSGINKIPKMVRGYLGGDQGLELFHENLKSIEFDLDETDLLRYFFWFSSHYIYNKRRVLEKTPRHFWNSNKIFNVFPSAKLIVCTRDPLDIIISYRKRLNSEKAKGLPESHWAWLNLPTSKLISDFKKFDEELKILRNTYRSNIFTAPYNWIASDTVTAMKEICEFCGIKYSEALFANKERADGMAAPLGSKVKSETIKSMKGVLSEEEMGEIATAGLEFGSWKVPGIYQFTN